jgi:cellulose synthase/poly-beta-1,6-N-acetylglucosamine synthase-like glycosyltransferase
MPAPDWLERALVHLADPGVGATGGHTRVPEDASWIERTLDFHATYPGVQEVAFLPTANLLLRRDVFESVGGFTENLRTGEDSDLSDRLRDQGLRLVSDTAILAVHQAYPKTVSELFRREMWHSSGIFRLFRSSGYQPRYLLGILVAAGYAAALLGALGCLIAAAAHGDPAWLLAAALLALSFPTQAAVTKALNKGRFDFLHLSIPYYAIVLLGRIAAGLRTLWHRRDDRTRW